MPENEPVIAEADARAMVRLVGDVAAIDGSLVEKRRVLMDRLREAIDADAWMWVANRLDPGHLPHVVHYEYGGFTEPEFASIVQAQSQEDFSALQPGGDRMLQLALGDGPGTIALRRLLGEEHWFENEFNRKFRQGWLDDMIVSVLPIEPQKLVTAVGLHRRWGRPAFTAREAQMAHIVTSEVRWLHEAIIPGNEGEGVPQLTPRQRQVLLLLIEGHPVKRVAHLLGISYHTADGYVKQLYKHYRVSSRAELMRQFLGGTASGKEK
jgi:DNA-binding CsgD family transcriptional regulator